MISSSTPAPTQASLYDGHDRQRGYSVNTKLVVLAYLTEAVIATASLLGAAIFARQYGDGDQWLMAQMMLAPIGYAAVEISRVPLALAVRTQASLLLRIVALVGVLCAAGVTVKSMSQLGEIMFRPRLVKVVQAQQRLEEAKKVKDNLELRIADADRLTAQRSGELQNAERQLALATEKFGGSPGQTCLPTAGMTRDGHTYKGMRCVADPRIAALTSSMNNARVERDAARARLASAEDAGASIARTTSEKQVAVAQADYDEAVLHSQLHSFTGMVFGKNPSEVTSGEIHQFLRIFVFLPAICSALAATLVALASVTRIKRDETVAVDDAASEYILAPFARHIIRDATEAAMSAMRATVNPSRPVLVPNAERKA